jgi:hypothetical protein
MKQQEKKVQTYVTMLMGEGFFDGHVCHEIINQVKILIREMIYVPWKIARLMNKHGSKLLMEVLDLFCTLETDGQKKYLPNTIICSSGSIKHVRKIIEDFDSQNKDPLPSRFTTTARAWPRRSHLV